MVRSMAGQGLLQHQVAAAAGRHRIAFARDHVGFDARQRTRRRARLGGRRARQRRDHDHAGFGLPPGVHDGAAVVADVLAIPHPGFGIDRLADGAQQAQALHGMLAPAIVRRTA
jgi:hypothetical protein